jgi:tetratricopeptide (TPR) repeat protein
MASVPRVFVSATSRDLGSYRKAVADALRSIDAHAVIQDEFPPDYRSVAAMLRGKIARCDAVICLVGGVYGAEPAERTADEPRRSYTQLEYESADALGKPVFVFVARDDCPRDHADDAPEADELRGLQLEYRKRVMAASRVWTPFRSPDDLVFHVRGMRFDPESLAQGFTRRLVVILTAELLDPGSVRDRQGEMAWARDVVRPYQELLRAVLVRWDGTVQAETPEQCQINFDTADAAVNAALDLHEALQRHNWAASIGAPGLRVGIHVGEIVRFGGVDESRTLQAGAAMTACRQLTELALPGQTLLTRTAFDMAREHVRRGPSATASEGARSDGLSELPPLRRGGWGGGQADVVVPTPLYPPFGRGDEDPVSQATHLDNEKPLPLRPEGEAGVSALRWCAHGRYRLIGATDDDDLDVYEVGLAGRAPLVAPPDSPRARRAGSLAEQQMEGWWPAGGQEVPNEPGWIIESKLGEGGFGEVWVAQNRKLRERRVFKFCFEAARLSSFKRELTLFKLLRDALGDRTDIARLLEVRLDEPPYYLVSEFVPGGNFRAWSEQDQRLAGLPLDERLRLVAAIARATAAAHSVGIIHKDLKPSNIFMRRDDASRWHPLLADFGIGAVADRAELQKRGITVAGWTQSLLEPGSSRTGTRMYQPPEASAGRPAMMQADVFALGVLLYQVLLGDLDTPFGEGWEDELRAAWTRMGLDPARDRRWGLLCGDIRSCVVKDPTRRLGTAAQVVERLETLEARVAQEDARREAATARERARRIRRLRRALAGALAVLLLVAGLGVFAAWQRHAALASARQAAANAGEARRQSRFAWETLNKLGELRLQAGEVSEAIGIYEDAVRIIEALAQANPDAAESRHDRAISYEKLGDVYRRLGRIDKALVMYQKSLELHAMLAGANPNTTQAQSDLAASYERVGLAHMKGDEPAKALPMYQTAVGLRKKLVELDSYPRTRRDLCNTYEELGDIQLELGATDKALEMYQQWLGLRTAIAHGYPYDLDDRRDLSLSYAKLGEVQTRLGNPAKALQMYQKGLEESAALAQEVPDRAQAQRDLSSSCRKLGGAYQQAGNLAQAQTYFARALDVDTKTTVRFPGDAAAMRDLATDCESLSVLSLQMGEWGQGADFAERAIEHARRAHRIEGAKGWDFWEYPTTFCLLGQAQAAAGRLAEARKSLDAAIEADARSGQSHNKVAWLLATTWNSSLRDGKRAVALATQACELTEWNEPGYLDTLAAAYAEAGQFTDAVKWETKALERPDALRADLEPAQARLKLYQAGQPYHEPRPEPGAEATQGK